MGQPIKKIVQEAHPDLCTQPFYTLLVDGTNLLKISFADTSINTKGEHYGGVFQFLNQLKKVMEKRPFDYVYVFFDDEFSGKLRYDFYNDYKANRDKKYDEYTGEPMSDYMKAYLAKVDSMRAYFSAKANKEKWKKKKQKEDDARNSIKKVEIEAEPEFSRAEKDELEKINFARERDILCRYFNELFIRWMMDDITEGDDLISYYVHHKKPEERIYIMSSDEDLTQLIGENVYVYNPKKKTRYTAKSFKEERGFPHENVVLKKIILGDISDNIGNIKGVSEARLIELMPEINERPVTIEEIKDRARTLCEERVLLKKKPLQWQENIISGTANKNYNGDFYEINEKLVNLNTPLLTKEAEEELSSMMYEAQDPEGRSFGNLYKYITEDEIIGLMSDSAFSNFFVPFNELVKREKLRYEKKYGKKV